MIHAFFIILLTVPNRTTTGGLSLDTQCAAVKMIRSDIIVPALNLMKYNHNHS